tara:strand:+ start:5346 stop:5525 length:180 start_codon:yes stop_codon:yes gene_type:complete
METLIVGLVLFVVAIFEPGNVEINDYCRASLEGKTEETFGSRKECWDEYNQYRDAIPKL